ncbi:phytanoyl-CoA dioxygenase family protein [bacterium]|nr:phytanoyl-CoA dioxygenase family protein [bacterium]
MLTQQQRKEFFERGFTCVAGALSQDLAANMVSRIWRALERRQGIRRDDSTTWIEGGVRGIGDLNREPEFRPFGSPPVVAVIDDLLGKDNWRQPATWGQILATFPAKDWSWSSLFQGQVEVSRITWHTDYPYDMMPDELTGVQLFGLLADLEPGGGATLVIEASHRVIQNFVRNQPPATIQKMKRARTALMESHPWLQSVSRAVSLKRPETWMAEQHAVINEIAVSVTELVGKAGDVYFTHPWLLHAISPNCNSTPRLMCTQRIHTL